MQHHHDAAGDCSGAHSRRRRPYEEIEMQMSRIRNVRQEKESKSLGKRKITYEKEQVMDPRCNSSVEARKRSPVSRHLDLSLFPPYVQKVQSTMSRSSPIDGPHQSKHVESLLYMAVEAVIGTPLEYM